MRNDLQVLVYTRTQRKGTLNHAPSSGPVDSCHGVLCPRARNCPNFDEKSLYHCEKTFVREEVRPGEVFSLRKSFGQGLHKEKWDSRCSPPADGAKQDPDRQLVDQGSRESKQRQSRDEANKEIAGRNPGVCLSPSIIEADRKLHSTTPATGVDVAQTGTLSACMFFLGILKLPRR